MEKKEKTLFDVLYLEIVDGLPKKDIIDHGDLSAATMKVLDDHNILDSEERGNIFDEVNLRYGRDKNSDTLQSQHPLTKKSSKTKKARTVNPYVYGLQRGYDAMEPKD